VSYFGSTQYCRKQIKAATPEQGSLYTSTAWQPALLFPETLPHQQWQPALPNSNIIIMMMVHEMPSHGTRHYKGHSTGTRHARQ
jgi:hypothetical protein